MNATDPQSSPPDPSLWVKHSPRLEFSISTLASITFHVVLFGLFFLIVARLMNTKTGKPEVPFRSLNISSESGDDDLGSKGSGGGAPVEQSDLNITPMVSIPDVKPIDLEKVKVSVATWVPDLKPDNEIIEVVASSASRDKLEKMDRGLRNELLKGLGEKKSQGNGPGKGNTGQAGAGEGGETDRAKSKRRALGWNIIFETTTAKSYLDQLASMNATLIFPKPGEPLANAVMFTELSKGYNGVPFGAKELNTLFFADEERHSMQPLARELKLDFSPELMIAVFPKDVEERLAQLSMAYRNLPEDRIEQTDFKILIKNGKYNITVVSQIAKKGKR